MRKVLFDEGVPRGLRAWIEDADIVTVQWLTWHGIKNGELLRRIQEVRFDAVVTTDKQWEFQQNLDKASFGVVVLSDGNWLRLRIRLSEVDFKDDLNRKIQSVKQGEVLRVDV